MTVVGTGPDRAVRTSSITRHRSNLCRPGKLVRMIDGASDGNGAAMSHLIWIIESGADPDELRNFVRFTSEFYPQLAAYYARRLELWFEANFPRQDETEDLD